VGGGDPDRSSAGVLLTGATGFLGMELLARYLECTDRCLYALVRGRSNDEARARVARTLVSLFGEEHRYGGRVHAVRGDITSPGLGLGVELDWLAERVGEIVHAAASVSFELGLEPSRKINLGGTDRILEFAARCQVRGGLRRLSYISTAYVAGGHAGPFAEDQLSVGQRFHNAYEQSKFEAELLVARWRERLPITVFRPSIVVGERESGWTASFNVLYWPLRAFARGTYVAVPARRQAAADVVSVDYVADAVIALSRMPAAEGLTYHLTAGADAASVGELIELAADYFDRPAPILLPPRLYRRAVHPILLRTAREPRRRRALTRSEAFFPYFATKLTFSDARARADLDASGIKPARLPTYFRALVEFALAADWGRRPICRASVAARTRPDAADVDHRHGEVRGKIVAATD
jgi:long-chain acyl-CoA synthetase